MRQSLKSLEHPLVLMTLVWVCFALGCDDGASRNMQGPIGIVDTNPAGHGWLGVTCASKPVRTLEVIEVMGEGPASLAGILPGDVIVSIDGVDLTTYDELITKLKQTKPRDVVEFHVVRNGQTLSTDVRLSSRLEMMMLPDAVEERKQLP